MCRSFHEFMHKGFSFVDWMEDEEFCALVEAQVRKDHGGWVRWNALVSHQASRTRFGSFRRKELEDSFHKPSLTPRVQGSFRAQGQRTSSQGQEGEGNGSQGESLQRTIREKILGGALFPKGTSSNDTHEMLPQEAFRDQILTRRLEQNLACFWTWDI